jgi:hypothetical protein
MRREPEPTAAGPTNPRTPAWRRLVPLLLAAALVTFVVARLDLRAFRDNLARVDAPLYLGFTVVFVLSLLAADSFATVTIYRRAVAPVRFGEFFVVRGASYLPSILNHHVGQAFITYFLSRAYGVPFWRVAGATLLVYASWMGCLLGIASAALLLTGQPAAWLLLPLGAGVAYLAVLAWRPPALARTRLLAPLFEAGVLGHLRALAARLPHVVVLFIGTWLPFWFFDVRIPFAYALSTIPIVMVVVTLPLTPQGLGTRDVIAGALFERFAAGDTHDQRLAAIAAATTSWVVAITLVDAVIGAVLMRWVVPRVLGARPDGAAGTKVGADHP